jgi:hypothetical protein
MTPPRLTFVPDTVLKRDVFSETVAGHAAEDPARKLALRRLDGLPRATRWLARLLARREARALRAVAGIAGTPVLHRADDTGLLRDWSDGTPLQIARPGHAEFYRDARRLLREMRRRGVTHNDLAKPQNWLMTPEGRAAVIDFQLARVHRRKGRWFRIAGYEDLRHLAKMKRKFAPHLLTPTEARLAARRSLPSRAWRATGKQLYNLVTRRLLHWSDAEGSENRAERDGPALRARLLAHPRVHDVAFATFPMSGRGVGLYGFAMTDLAPADLRALVPETELERLQSVTALPPQEALDLIAGNRMDELEAWLVAHPDQRKTLAPIAAGRLNLTDRTFT